jgi:trypsin
MKRVALVVSVLLLASGSPARAIDGGTPDGTGHPNVGLVGFDFDGAGELPPFAICTGSVISDRAFLTAAHCIRFLPPGVEWVVTLDGGSPADPLVTPAVFPDEFPFAITVPVERAIDVIVHPGFGAGESHANDLAVLLFEPETFAGVTPVGLPAEQRDDLDGARVMLVGYGTDAAQSPPAYFFPGYRRTASTRVHAVTQRWLKLQDSGVCYGDSGSPQLLDGVAVSQLSNSLKTCRGEARAQRLDVPAARRFLAQFAG